MEEARLQKEIELEEKRRSEERQHEVYMMQMMGNIFKQMTSAFSNISPPMQNYGNRTYFDPKTLQIVVHTSVMITDAVRLVIPNVFVVMQRDPLSFKEYKVIAAFYSRVTALKLVDLGSGEI